APANPWRMTVAACAERHHASAASSTKAEATTCRRPRTAGRPAAVRRRRGMTIGLVVERATSAYRHEAELIEARPWCRLRDKSPRRGSTGVAQPRGDAVDRQVDAALHALGGRIVLAPHAVAAHQFDLQVVQRIEIREPVFDRA